MGPAEAVVDSRPPPNAALEEFQRHERFGSIALRFAERFREPAHSVLITYWVEGCTIPNIAIHLNMSGEISPQHT